MPGPSIDAINAASLIVTASHSFNEDLTIVTTAVARQLSTMPLHDPDRQYLVEIQKAAYRMSGMSAALMKLAGQTLNDAGRLPRAPKQTK